MKRIGIIGVCCFLVLVGSGSVSVGLVDHSIYTEVPECLECHPRALPTHKRGTPRDMTEPLPLDSQGRMLCITCHDCLGGTCLLRRETARELCIICHDCSQGMACLIGVAHMGDSPDIKLHALTGCLACHDGTSAPAILEHEGHPVDVLHMPESRNELKQITDRRVVLVNGKITCISCHNPYGSDEVYLARSNDGSKLCLACHLK